MTSTVDAPPERIDRDQLEAKFREIRGEVDDVAAGAVNYALVAGVVVVVGVVALAYVIGKRRGRRRGTVIEVRRL